VDAQSKDRSGDWSGEKDGAATCRRGGPSGIPSGWRGGAPCRASPGLGGPPPAQHWQRSPARLPTHQILSTAGAVHARPRAAQAAGRAESPRSSTLAVTAAAAPRRGGRFASRTTTTTTTTSAQAPSSASTRLLRPAAGPRRAP